MLIQMHERSKGYEVTEFDVLRRFEVSAQKTINECRRVAKLRREQDRTGRRPEGTRWYMYTPQVLIDQMLKNPEYRKLYQDDPDQFWRLAWDWWPDLRCLSTKRCPIPKRTRLG